MNFLYKISLATTLVVGILSSSCMAHDKSTSMACNAPVGWKTVADAAKGKILLFGEPHGTQEIPEAFVSYVCAVADSGVPTIVALEISETLHDGLQAVSIASDKRDSLLKNLESLWLEKDGRGSVAMFEMIRKLYDLENVKVVPIQRHFNLTAPEGVNTQEEMLHWSMGLTQEFRQQKAEEAYAAAIMDSRSGKRDETTIVLVGSDHAAKVELGHMPNVKPMAMMLPPKLTISLKVEHTKGTAWVHSPQGIGPTYFGRNLTVSPRDLDQTEMGFAASLGPKYDGYLYVGSISHSPPMLSDIR